MPIGRKRRPPTQKEMMIAYAIMGIGAVAAMAWFFH
jgi:hypothetical protein